MKIRSKFSTSVSLGLGLLACSAQTASADSLWSEDAAISLVADKRARGVGDIITLDRKQFEVYRFAGNRRFNHLMPATGRRTRRSH